MQFTAEIGGGINFDRVLALASKDKILIGWPSGMAHANSDETLDEIAKKLHFGFVTEDGAQVPPRPLLTDALNENRAKLTEQIGRLFRSKVEGNNSSEGLAAIGVYLVGIVKRFAFGGYYRETVPNALSTIVNKSKPATVYLRGDRKGTTKSLAQTSDKPWIDTSQTVNAVTYLVQRGQSVPKQAPAETEANDAGV
jgi:hypothetical protein